MVHRRTDRQSFGLATLVLTAFILVYAGRNHKTLENHQETEETRQTEFIDIEKSPVKYVNEINSKIDNSLERFARYTAGFEGRRNKVYDPNPNDGKPEPTIGVGHFMDRGDSRETFAKVLPEVNYDSVYNGKTSLTKTQIERLFAYDIKEYVTIARRLVPRFNELSVEVQTALVDMAYRGDLGGSPKTKGLINSGKLREAANEYINSKEYRNAGRNGMRGIKNRMDSNRRLLLERVK